VHRHTGWSLIGAFPANAVSVLIFGARVIWLARIPLVTLVICLVLRSRVPGGWPDNITADRTCVDVAVRGRVRVDSPSV
jgi:hypothetical protein